MRLAQASMHISTSFPSSKRFNSQFHRNLDQTSIRTLMPNDIPTCPKHVQAKSKLRAPRRRVARGACRLARGPGDKYRKQEQNHFDTSKTGLLQEGIDWINRYKCYTADGLRMDVHEAYNVSVAPLHDEEVACYWTLGIWLTRISARATCK